MEIPMFEGLVPVLALGTLLAVAVFALISKERTKDRMRDPNAPVSTLAKDGKFGGVAFLRPLAERWADARDPVGQRPAAHDPVADDRVSRALY
ncbi:MAG: hypothetical protein EAZ40_11035 [Rhodobacterales bacterium]|nr:MAG: hypothetical protein EAZ40_11035 [Rhodobacterales bacterium]